MKPFKYLFLVVIDFHVFSVALAATIISPETGPNLGFSGPFLLPAGLTSRYQQVYQASDFHSLEPGGGIISEIGFFPYNDGVISATILNLQINLSTSPRAPDALSTVFAENVGSDETVVLGLGEFAFTVQSGFTFQLDRPFFYDPSVGNLLLDVRNFSGANGVIMGSLAAANYAGDSTSVVSGQVNDLMGGSRTWGLNTHFIVTPVPEPASMALFLAGGLLIAWRWRRGV